MAHIKNINGGGYLYKSVREGKQVKSVYLGPVEPKYAGQLVTNAALVYGDFDGDGVPNIDDKLPLNRKVAKLVDVDTKLSDQLKEIENFTRKGKPVIKSARKIVHNLAPKADVSARVKSVPSVVEKLKRKGLQSIADAAGVRLVTDNKAMLRESERNLIEGLPKRGVKIRQVENFYEKPRPGKEFYKAVHIDAEINNVPVEIQLKTKRQHELQLLTHRSHKAGKEFGAFTEQEARAEAEKRDREDS